MNQTNLNGRLPPDEHPDVPPDELDEVRAYLHRWRAPVPDPAAQARLLSALQSEWLASAAPAPLPIHSSTRHRFRTAWLVLWSQTRVIHTWLWVASALILALGALVTFTIQAGVGGTALPLTIVAPVVAALGIALLYGGDSDPAIELVLSTPISPRLIVLARLSLVFGFNLLLATMFSIVLSMLRADIALAPLILDWFAPMTLLSGLAFLLSAFLFDPLASGLISFCLWVVAVARHFDLLIGGDVLRFLPDLLRADLHLPMIALGVFIFALAFLRIEHEERWTQQHA